MWNVLSRLHVDAYDVRKTHVLLTKPSLYPGQPHENFAKPDPSADSRRDP